MSAAGQISQIEGDAADCAGYGVLVYVFVTIQNKTHPVDEPLRTQKLPGSVQGALLNIESDDLTVSTDERGEKCRVVAVACGCIDNTGHREKFAGKENDDTSR